MQAGHNNVPPCVFVDTRKRTQKEVKENEIFEPVILVEGKREKSAKDPRTKEKSKPDAIGMALRTVEACERPILQSVAIRELSNNILGVTDCVTDNKQGGYDER